MSNKCNKESIKKCHKQSKVCNPKSGRCISPSGKTYNDLSPEVKFQIETIPGSSEERKSSRKKSSSMNNNNNIISDTEKLKFESKV